MLRIAFVGAGQVNFGGGEGPWNHARRLEELYGVLTSPQGTPVEITVVGIYDPFVAHANRILNRQQSITKHPSLWKETQVFGDYHTMFESLTIDAVFIGVPPASHGSTVEPNDIAVQCAKTGIHMFIEKPLSSHPLELVKEVESLLSAKPGLIVSVGYMFRYSQAVKKMKEIIETHGAPRAFMARYNCAYSSLAKEMWWDVTKSGGPIVEQATHFCDLARYIVGEVDLNSVIATSISSSDSLGSLSKLPPNIATLEENLPEQQKIPRVTSAMWKFKSGAIGTLMHGVLLHENKYESEIEIWGDGYRMVLTDPYSKCLLTVRLPGSEETKVVPFEEEDVYYIEDKIFFDAIISGSDAQITSPYKDSYETYKFTWKIRTQCELSSQ